MKKALLFSLLLLVLGASAQTVGAKSPEISLKNPKGEIVKLSSLKGKVVLVDFWASWCGPCREANPGLKLLYDKYKAQGFEIYSISLDRTKAAWKAGIKKDKITWSQVWDEDGAVATKWNIGYIPQTFLLDKTGKIVAAELEHDALEGQLKNLL
jgi:peroxiredoxin